MIVQIKNNSSLYNRSLYDLQKIMGKCSGHGSGFDREDIGWQISQGKGWWKYLSISFSGSLLNILFTKYYDDHVDKPYQNISLHKLPRIWRVKLKKVLENYTNMTTL